MSKLINILDVNDFDNRYREEWKSGKITDESLDILFDLLSGLSVEWSISKKIKFNLENIICLLLKYRYKSTQCIDWIEPIRMCNWALYSWISVDPEVINYASNERSIKDYIRISLNIIFGYGHVKDYISDETREQIEKDFTLSNLGNIDFVENYLKKYAKSDKVIKALQRI